MTNLQRDERDRRAATADRDVDVQQMLSESAHLSPVRHNASDTWAVGGLDKGGFLTAPISAEEVRMRDEAQTRAKSLRSIIQIPAQARTQRKRSGKYW